MKKNILVGLVALLVFVVASIGVGTCQPTADWLGIESDFTVIEKESVTIPVNISNTQNDTIAGIILNIEYNKNVLNLTGINKGNLLANWDTPYFKVFEWGVRMVSIYSGFEDDAISINSAGSLFLLNFDVIGSPSETSELKFTNSLVSSGIMKIGCAPVKNATATVISEYGVIYGRILGTADIPMNNVYVSLENDTAVLQIVQTDINGDYQFTNIPPGSEYRINATKTEYWLNSTVIAISAGETKESNMILWLLCDLNGDEVIDLIDLILMKKAVVWEIEPTWQYDLNKNGIDGDIGDLVLLKRRIVG